MWRCIVHLLYEIARIGKVSEFEFLGDEYRIVNMGFSQTHINKYILIIGIAIFLVTSVFGLPLSGMLMGMHGEMIGCPFMDMDGASICHMSLFEHISTWQGTFASVVDQHGVGLLLMLLAAVLSFTLVSLLGFLRNIARLPLNQRHLRRRVTYRLFFQAAFSSGILNPKLF